MRRWLLIALVVLVACSVPNGQVIPAEKFCLSDSDCVKASCCHPADAVNMKFAPNCTAVLCSQECSPNTLDCGQGKIRCVNNSCSAVISKVEE